MPHPVVNDGLERETFSNLTTLACTPETSKSGLLVLTSMNNSATNAALSQEETSQHLSEEIASIRCLLGQHHSEVLEKLEQMSTQKVYPTLQTAAMQRLPMRRSASEPFNAKAMPEAKRADSASQLADSASYLSSASQSGLLEQTQKNVLTAKKKIKRQQKERQDNPSELSWMPTRVRSFVRSNPFEIVMVVTIFLNVLVMAGHLQWKGYDAGFQLGMRSDDGSYARLKVFFDVAENVFNGVYVIEMVLRIWAFKSEFFKSLFNWFELMIVISTCLETFVFEALAEGTDVNLSILRILRIFRIFRVIRIIRVAEHFSELRVLLKTLISSMRSVCWSFLLIGGIVLSSSILLVQMSLVFLRDESVNLERRQWLFHNFGTTGAALYTMVECTLSGGWRFFSRPMIEEVSLIFVVFWIPYIALVNFTVIKVVSALFLKQTLAVAAMDDERLAMAKMKEKERYASELRVIFEAADTSKDGAISVEEFSNMLYDEHVMEHFAEMDLDVDEVAALFSVLSADDGVADYEDFLTGALKMKGSARTIDTVQVMSHQLKLQRTLDALREQLLDVVLRQNLSAMNGVLRQ